MNRGTQSILVGASLLAVALHSNGRQAKAPPPQDQQEASPDVAPNGVTPRTSPARYSSHAESKGVGVGARLLTRDELRQEFTANLDSCCLVVEVALYPAKGETMDIARKDFALSVGGTKKAVQPSSPELLASGLKTSSREGDLRPHGSVGVTYGPPRPGDDPGMGQPIGGHSVDTSAQISIGAHPPDSYPTDLDRTLWELELTRKGLPEGKFSAPVAGYLYFPRTKKKKNATRQLDCTLAGVKIALAIP